MSGFWWYKLIHKYMKTLTLSDCTVEIKACQELEPIQSVLGFERTGLDHSEYIKKVLDDEGFNVWLWCSVEVELSYKNILYASDNLGCCIYNSEAEFKNDGYYTDMVNTCLNELNSQLKELNEY